MDSDIGNVYANLRLLWSHIAAAELGVLALIPYVWKKILAEGGWLKFRNRFDHESMPLANKGETK